MSARNVVGTSALSSLGGDGIILSVPSEPQFLRDVPNVTSDVQIGLAWDAPSSTGGTPVIDYRVFQSSDGVTFSIIDSNIEPQLYTALTLLPGNTYFFRISARNSQGYGT